MKALYIDCCIRGEESRSSEGSGLGLSIVKHGASFHHASLELQSEPGKGTEIRLRFPVGEEPKQKNCLS